MFLSMIGPERKRRSDVCDSCSCFSLVNENLTHFFIGFLKKKKNNNTHFIFKISWPGGEFDSDLFDEIR